jgi:hypothetical protein
MPFSYSVYGLRVKANLPIPGLPTCPSPPEDDVQFWLKSTPPLPAKSHADAAEASYISSYRDEQGEPVLKAWSLVGGAYSYHRYCDGMELVIDRAGTQVWADWPESLTAEDAAVYLLGPVLGFVLRLRGTTCLHASAVAFGEVAVALLGRAGAGKSTTAAAFAGMGHPILSDDVVALSERDGTLYVEPAYPHLRLWPSSVDMLYGTPHALPRLVPEHPSWDKCYLSLDVNEHVFQRQPLPLAAVYLLDGRADEPSAPFVENMPDGAKVMALVANTYANQLIDRELRAREFALLSRLVVRVPVRRVVPHSDPARLPDLCAALLEDFGRTSEVGVQLATPNV